MHLKRSPCRALHRGPGTSGSPTRDFVRSRVWSLFEPVALDLAVDHNDQFRSWAIEIHEVSVTGPLPSEKIARHFALFHLVSQLHVRHGAALPEFPRALLQLWVMVKHDLITLRSQTPALPKETSPYAPFKGGMFSKSLLPSKAGIAPGNPRTPRF